MTDTYIATQGVGEFLAGQVVTGLSEERLGELEKSGAVAIETAEQAKLRKASAKVEEEDAIAAEKAATTKK